MWSHNWDNTVYILQLPSGLCNILQILFYKLFWRADRDSSVGIATRYGMDGTGIESRWEGEIFHIRPAPPSGPPSLLYNGYRAFTGGKAAGAWRWPPIPSSAEVKERVELYLYTRPYRPSWPVLEWTYLYLYRYCFADSRRKNRDERNCYSGREERLPTRYSAYMHNTTVGEVAARARRASNDAKRLLQRLPLLARRRYDRNEFKV
jgi:hypothetical protein